MLGRDISNWIYVTGAPRSGTTFVGSILSAPLSVDYIHEPFNPDCGLPSVDQRYLYLAEGHADLDKYLPDIEALLAYRATLRTAYYPRDSRLKKAVKSVVGSRGRFYYRIARMNPFHRSAVIKDPIGCLLTGFLQQKFGMRPVILVRHPVTFVASVLRLGWDMSLGPLLEQDELVDDYLAAEEGELRSIGENPIVAAAYTWRVLNSVLQQQAQSGSGWYTVRHEDVSKNPLREFQKLYNGLDLPWSGRVGARVRRWTGSGNDAEAAAGRVQDFRRDSSKLHDLRIAMLEPEQRRRIYEITGQVASNWYDEPSYQI